jgi:hypothetical protein
MGPSGRKTGEDERKWGKTAMAEQVFKNTYKTSLEP